MQPQAVVQPFIEPAKEAMLAHLEHLFGGFLEGYHDGLIELAWTDAEPDASGKHRLRHAQLFGTDRFDDIVDKAISLNRQHGVNVYIGAWLRHPDTPPFGRSEDKDAWALTAPYVDLDEENSTATAIGRYGDDKPTWVTETGRQPHMRAQLWWKLDEPLTDHAQASALLRGMAREMGGDETVCNPGRVMRLAGSIAWPVKPGRVLELTRSIPLRQPGPPVYAVPYLERTFPPISEAAKGSVDTGAAQPITTGKILPKLADGREEYMRDTVAACLVGYMGEHGAVPEPQELFDMVWPQYSRNVDLTRPGRGANEVAEKCATAIRRFEAGKIRGIEDIDKAIARYQQKQKAREGLPKPESKPEIVPPARQDTAIKTVDFYTLYTEQVPEEHDYIEPDFLGPGSFGLIAGPPKAQKSFLLQEGLVAAATGTSFLMNTFRAPHPLRVFYLQAEMNRKLLRRRAREMQFLTAEQKELLSKNLIISERFHMILNEGGVKTAIETIKGAFPDEPPDIIAVDPLANVFDQENESDNAQMMRFLTGRLEAVRQAVNPLAAIILVHHATKRSSEDMARDPFVAIRGAGALRGYYDSAIVIFWAGEESKARKVHFELRSGESPEPMTVELVGGRFVASSKTAEIPKDTARKILADIGAAWRSNEPWSPYERSRKEGRYVVENVVRKHSVPPDAIKALIDAWLANKVLAFRERVYRKHPAGFEVTGSID